MNKKEISEIKKQFTPDNCAITRICGCYVDGEKNKKTKLKEAFLSLSEEEIDRKLTEYFATHPVLTRTNMQSLCSFTQSMASRQIRRLKAEGKLQNIGKPTQPIYVAGTGYYI